MFIYSRLVTLGEVFNMSCNPMPPKKEQQQGEALLEAAEKNSHEKLKELLENGAPVNYANQNGETAVWFASRNVCLECLGILKEHDANLNARLKTGVTGLWIAAANGHFEVIQLLLDGHADPNIPDSRGVTALWTSASYGFHEIVELLLRYGADCDSAKHSGETSFWMACQLNFRRIVGILITHGADLELARDDGHTPLMAAAEGGFTDIVNILIEQRVRINRRSSNGHTALTLAACNGHDAVVSLLLNAGANPFIAISKDMPCVLDLSVCPLAQCCAYEQHSTAGLLWDRVSGMQRRRAIEICQKLGYCTLAERLSSFGSAYSGQVSSYRPLNTSDFFISDLCRKMTQAGFTKERSRVQVAAADIVQDFLRCYFHRNTLFVLGSYGDGWGCNLSTADGSIGPESDIDFAEIMSRQKFHLRDFCKCPDIKEEEKVTYKHGHVKLSRTAGVGSRPAMTTEASPTTPSMDVVYAYSMCCYPRLITDESSDTLAHFPTEIVEQLRNEVASCGHPFHLIRAGTPAKEGTQLRVSTSILEQGIMRSLSTDQGQFYILLKFIIKKVLGVSNQQHQSMGLKSYHAKSLLFFMLKQTPKENWSGENLRQLLISALQMLNNFMGGSNDEDYCMPHFFLAETVLYLKRDHSPKWDILNHVRQVILEIDVHLCRFRDQLKPLNTAEYYSLHIFSLFPFGFSLFDDSNESDNELHSAYVRIKRYVQRILNSKEPPLHDETLSDIERLPGMVKTAKLCLEVLTHLRFQKYDKARSVLIDNDKSTLRRHLHVKEEESSEKIKRDILEQLKDSDSTWRMCCRIDSLGSPDSTAMVCPECFPSRMPNHERRLYLNFDVLLQLLKLRLLKRSEWHDSMAAWSQSVMENSNSNADFEELYAAALLSSDISIKRSALKAMRRLFQWRHEKTDVIINDILGDTDLQVVGRVVLHNSCSEACFLNLFDS